MIDTQEYTLLARDSKAYQDIELDILQETLKDWEESPGDPFVLLELRDGEILAGFAIMTKSQGTEFTYEIRDICIDRAYIGNGVTSRLLEMLEEETLRKAKSAILRIEISKKKAEAIGLESFHESEFALIGHIENFYSQGNDYYMFVKHLFVPRVEPEKADDKARSGAPR